MSNNRGDSILTHDGSLNVDLLSKEIARDAAGEDKYKAEDSMKKRAIYNSKDYDEFRAFVSCSQLKPVHGQEMTELLRSCGGMKKDKASRKYLNKWPKSGNKSIPINSSKLSPILGEEFPRVPASNYMEFQRDWNRFCKTDSEKIRYMSLYSPEVAVTTIFSVEMGATVLSDICRSLYQIIINDAVYPSDTIRDGKFIFVMKWMNAIPKSGRFSLNSAFLGESEKENIRSICIWLGKQESIDDCLKQKISTICRSFSIVDCFPVR